MRLFFRNTLIALIGVAGLMLVFWCFNRAFDWAAFRVFHLPVKAQPSFVRELKFWCETGLGGLLASIVFKLKSKLFPAFDLETPEHYSVAEPVAFGLVLFAMMLIGVLAINRFH